MVTSRDAQTYLKALGILAQLHIIPFELHFENRYQVVMKPTKGRGIVWILFFLYGFFRLCLSVYNLSALLTTGVAPTYELSIHALEILGGIAVTVLQILSFFREPQITAAIFSFIFTGVRSKKRVAKIPLRSLSIQECYGLNLIYVVYSVTSGLTILVVFFCTKVNLYQLLPKSWQNPLTFTLSLVHENLFWFGRSAAFIVTCSNMLLFFENVGSSLHNELDSLRSNTCLKSYDVEKVIFVARRTELVVRLFNSGYSSSVYFFKILYITTSVFGLYFGIRALPVHGAIAFFLVYVGLFALGCYVIIFDKAFLIPAYIKMLKREVLKSAKLSTFQRKDKCMFSSRIEAVSDVGIKVGGFHTMERESTPIFVDFVFQQVVSLLMTFQ